MTAATDPTPERDESIRAGIAEAHAGQTRPADEIFAELGLDDT